MTHVSIILMSYSSDLRMSVLRYVRDGGSQTEASRVFGVSRKTIYRWLQLPDDFKNYRRKAYRSKLDKQALAEDIQRHPDDYLRERAQRFGVTPQTIWYALKRLNVVKKNDEVCGDKSQ